MDAADTNPESAQDRDGGGLGRRTFLKGASMVGGSLITAGLVAGPQATLARNLSEGAAAAAATSAASSRRAGSAALTPKEKEVLDLIDENEVASVLQDFVRIHTDEANEQAGAAYFARRLREWGIPDVMIQGIEWGMSMR